MDEKTRVKFRWRKPFCLENKDNEMHFYIQQTLKTLICFSLGVAGATNFQTRFPLISESRVGNGIIILASNPTLLEQELVPIEPIRSIKLRSYVF